VKLKVKSLKGIIEKEGQGLHLDIEINGDDVYIKGMDNEDKIKIKASITTIQKLGELLDEIVRYFYL